MFQTIMCSLSLTLSSSSRLRWKLFAPLLAAIVLACSFALPTKQAAADGPSLKICNQTSDQISVAAGYFTTGSSDTSSALSGPFVSRGWWAIDPGQCASIGNPFAARYMYWNGYMAHKWAHSDSPWLWTDSYTHFCAPNIRTSGDINAFSFEQENANGRDGCVNGPQYNSNGPNEWVPSREVDLQIDTTVYYTGV
jgi:uncharacterized membrane protein